VLVDTYASTIPGVEATEDDPNAVLLKKYDRINIYSSTTVVDENGKERIWYQVGPNQWLHQFNVSKFEALKTLPEGVDTDLWFAIDVYEQNVTMYRGTTPVFITLTGTGLDRWPTYEGLFHIYFRNERENMSWGTVGDDYYLIEEVPWTMYFDGGRALHGAYWHNAYGYRRSHGCVNLSITDAHYIYEQVDAFLGEDAGSSVDGPAVYVFSSGTYDIKQ
jgi:lipoprotein-anchoring transpeptidase ErfK/SrfK